MNRSSGRLLNPLTGAPRACMVATLLTGSIVTALIFGPHLAAQTSATRPEKPASSAAADPDAVRSQGHSIEATKPAAPAKPSTVLVPAGEFYMGAASEVLEAPPEEKPQHRVVVKAFWIDRYEVTNAEYRKFLGAVKVAHPKTCSSGEPVGKDHAPDARWWSDPEWNAPEKPVMGVDWFDAYAYCAWAGKRLPTEAEWEKAARGADRRMYPWGNDPPARTPVGNFADESVKRINPGWRIVSGYDDGFPHTSPVGSFPKGASPYGAEDMAGNVWEWVADWYSPTAYGDPTNVDPKGPSAGERKGMRGGSWDSTPNFVRVTVRHTQFPAYRGISSGFRCARDGQ